MIYKKFKPAEVLQPFVECYFSWHCGEPVSNLVIESPPSGFCSIVFNSGDDYFLQTKKYERILAPKQFIVGQCIYSYKLFLNGNIDIVGIVFKPAALATLFSLPTYEYTEERLPLKCIFKEAIVDELVNKIESLADPNEKVKCLEEFVLKYHNESKANPDNIDYAANLIVEKNGMLHITDLLKEVYMSRRNFERKFFKKVGLSPKYYARIRRMGFLLNLIAGKKKVDWAYIFSLCEFYDQSHFIKDFIEFTGRTPQQYIEENSELVNYVEKPSVTPISP
jgi:AraC-like DNA-binding protein